MSSKEHRRVEVDNLGRIKLSDFKKMIAEGRATGTPQGMTFTLMRINYVAYFSPEKMSLYVKWEYQGKEYVEKITISKEKSNLGLNPVLYFRCPYSGLRCRKLFTDGRKFFCMKALTDGYTYSERNRRKSLRNMKYIFKEPPETAKRKLYYRGELTKFGKSLAKYYWKVMEAEDKGEILLEAQNRRRGRPAKPKAKIQPQKKTEYTPPVFFE